jgi:hypothetical protein
MSDWVTWGHRNGRPLLPDGTRVFVRYEFGGPPSASARKIEGVTWAQVAEYRVASGVQPSDLAQVQLQDGVGALAHLLDSLGAKPSGDLPQMVEAVTEHIKAQDAAYARLLSDRDMARLDLAAAHTGADAAANLSRLYQISAEVREARALRDYAGVKLEHALLREQIASAISRGHLPSDFYNQLREWCK